MTELAIVQSIVAELTKFGIITQFCYGPSTFEKSSELIWSVTCMNRTWDNFEKPFAANSLRQAAEIARLECEARGWCK
jgi:hypothetical protein